jgi:hypothetical protein
LPRLRTGARRLVNVGTWQQTIQIDFRADGSAIGVALGELLKAWGHQGGNLLAAHNDFGRPAEGGCFPLEEPQHGESDGMRNHGEGQKTTSLLGRTGRFLLLEVDECDGFVKLQSEHVAGWPWLERVAVTGM